MQTCLGFTDHLDDMPALGYAESSLSFDRIEEFLLLLYGHAANYQVCLTATIHCLLVAEPPYSRVPKSAFSAPCVAGQSSRE
jgi:hypothetical protein